MHRAMPGQQFESHPLCSLKPAMNMLSKLTIK
jgi:hypothetical protein